LSKLRLPSSVRIAAHQLDDDHHGRT